MTLEFRRGDVPSATRAVSQLLAVEESCGSNDIRATARLASARLAMHGGDHVLAIDELETALTLLIHRRRPLLNARIRLELARALSRAGERASALVEGCSASSPAMPATLAQERPPSRRHATRPARWRTSAVARLRSPSSSPRV